MALGIEGLTIWFRCFFCAPALEWRDDDVAALAHLIDAHALDLDRAMRALDLWSVDTTTPGLDSMAQED